MFILSSRVALNVACSASDHSYSTTTEPSNHGAQYQTRLHKYNCKGTSGTGPLSASEGSSGLIASQRLAGHRANLSPLGRSLPLLQQHSPGTIQHGILLHTDVCSPNTPMAIGGRKRVVISKPTRNGCRTCRYVTRNRTSNLSRADQDRIRKVKCDEARPVCYRCSSTGRTCDGYETSHAPKSATRRALLPSRSSSNSPPINRHLSMWTNITPDLCDAERHGYQFFLINTAPVMQLTYAMSLLTSRVSI